MKRTFLKVLPFAAALLLATSCSKDENNSVDEIVNGGEQTEIVVKTFKTITVKGKVNKSISKVTTNDAGTGLAFEGNEVFTFCDEGDDVYGTINFTKSDGSYTAIINYTDEQYLNDNFTATLGSNPAVMSDAYDDLAAAVQNAYYTIDFTITHEGDEYHLQSENSADIIVNLQSAFIKALSDEKTSLGSTEINVAADKFYVVPVGKTMGGTSNKTVAGKIYSLGTVNGIKYIEYSFDESSMQTSYTVKTLATGTYTELTNANPGSTTWTAGNWYVVSGDVTINQRIQISGTGDVHLILKDGATLNAAQGIQHATDGNSLIIYGQSQGTGILNANTTQSNYAGIGGNGNQGGASVTIHGGNVNASGYVGIGGCWNGGLRGTLTVYNGTVNATGSFGAGIGTGACSWVGAGTVLVYGGSINAIGGEAGAGIGGGRGDKGATVKVYAGRVKAIGGGGTCTDANAPAGIGGGRYDSNNSEHNGGGGTLEIYGGIVEAYGRSRSIGAGGPLSNAKGGYGTLTVSGDFDVVAGNDESSATATTVNDYINNSSNRPKYVKFSQKN